MQDILYYIASTPGIFENLNNGLENIGILTKKRYLDTLGQLASITGNKVRVCLYDPSNGIIMESNYGITDITNPRYSWLPLEVQKANENKQIYISPARLIQYSEQIEYFSVIIHPVGANNKSDVVSFIFLNTGVLMKELLNNTSNAGDAYTCYIINAEGSIIYHSNNDLIATRLPPNINKSLIEDGKYQKESVVMSAFPISGTTLYLVADINTEKLYAWVDKLIHLIFYITIVIMAILSIAAIKLSNVLYGPVHKVMRDVSIKLGYKSFQKDEFEFISVAFNNIENKYQQANSDLKTIHYILHRATLLNHLKMGQEQEVIEVVSDQITSMSKQQTYAVLLLKNDEIFESDQYKEILNMSLPNSEYFNNNDKLICVFPYETSMNDLKKLLQEDFYDKLAYKGCTVSICQNTRMLKELHRAYSEAMFTCILANFLNIDGIVGYNEILNMALGYIPLESEQVDELKYCLVKFDEKKFSKIINDYLPSGLPAIEFNKRICAMIAYMINHFKEDASVYINEFIDYIESNDKLDSSKMRSFFEKCFRSSSNRNSEEKSGIHIYLKKMNQFIEKNFDKLISLDDVSDYLGISKQYFCYIIKHEYNTTFINYLNKYRVEKAKLLLNNNETRINSISGQVGFSSDSYFIKVFKSITGLTPGEYQNYVLSNIDTNNN